jgi:hypothetical protein
VAPWPRPEDTASVQSWIGVARDVRQSFQSSRPLRYAIVDGLNVRDSRVHNYPPRWNAAPGQELLVIRRNHKTGEVSLDPLLQGPGRRA